MQLGMVDRDYRHNRYGLGRRSRKEMFERNESPKDKEKRERKLLVPLSKADSSKAKTLTAKQKKARNKKRRNKKRRNR